MSIEIQPAQHNVHSTCSITMASIAGFTLEATHKHLNPCHLSQSHLEEKDDTDKIQNRHHHQNLSDPLILLSLCM